MTKVSLLSRNIKREELFLKHTPFLSSTVSLLVCIRIFLAAEPSSVNITASTERCGVSSITVLIYWLVNQISSSIIHSTLSGYNIYCRSDLHPPCYTTAHTWTLHRLDNLKLEDCLLLSGELPSNVGARRDGLKCLRTLTTHHIPF